MPKFPKGFGRRKTILPPENPTDKPPPVVEHSFKVFERSERVGKSFDAGVRFSKTTLATIGRTNNVQIEDDNLFENIGSNHSSGASNTLTSVTDNSSRLSAVSTVPSSTDNTHGQEWTSPHDKPFTDIPPPPVPRKTTTFSLKSAGYAMSWGKQKAPISKELPSPIDRSDEEGIGLKLGTVKAASDANTTVPPKCYDRDSDHAYSQIMPLYERRINCVQETNIRDKIQESFITPKQIRSHPVLDLEKSLRTEPFTDAWSGQRSSQGLIVGASPSPVASRQFPRSPLVPHHVPPRVTSPAISSTSERRHVKSQEDETRSRSVSRERKSDHESSMPPYDEDAKLLQDSINASRQLNEQSSDAQGDWTASQSSPKFNSARRTTENLNPSGQNFPSDRKLSDDNIFDSSIVERANLAQKYQEQPISPSNSHALYTKVMTPAQFERYKLDQERLRHVGGNKAQDEGEDEEEGGYDDDGEDEDEIEKAKALARQRRKQEAHMAVYRQQMMKVTGETPGNTAVRPNLFSSQSSPNLATSGQNDDTEEEDEEIPLGILQAHGFPSKNKPPCVRNNSQNSNIKVAPVSSATSVIIDPRLPVFARNLPQDPYYGSGIVRPMQRESMAFSGGSSANSGVMKSLPPGGLVGVIATEERSRAMRRGSPIPQGEFSAQVSSNSIGGGHNNDSPGGMISMMGSGMPTNPIIPTMMLTPGDQAQIQMTQQMNQFMQMQMQFMQMMAQARPQSSTLPQQPTEIPRPASAQMHQRSQTLMNQNSVPWLNRASTYAPSMYAGNNYAPSIAPSERSNIGLPGRYRPVSQAPAKNTSRTRASSICGTLQNWDSKDNNRKSTTIKAVDNKVDHISDEDEDEAWEKLTKKKKEKRSMWRTKKDRDPNGLKEMLGYLS